MFRKSKDYMMAIGATGHCPVHGPIGENVMAVVTPGETTTVSTTHVCSEYTVTMTGTATG